MKKSNLLIAAVSLILAACQQPQVDRFAVSGTVTGAGGSTLYLDHLGHDRTETVDSVKLDSIGEYMFKQPSPDGCFDFYRLRLDGRTINFAVDSVQTIVIDFDRKDMQTGYSVSGSQSSQIIRQVVQRHYRLLSDIREAQRILAGPATGILSDRIMELVDLFKSEIRNQYIFADPGSAAAYYCLFLSINGQMLLNPQQDRQDAKTFAAVATRMDILYPNSQRTQYLHNLALKSMSMTAPKKPVSQETIDRFNSLIVESGLIDIELPDYLGQKHRLGQLKGNVVLLDFTAYKTNYSANYNLLLRDLYGKYSQQGFEIYQVSFDSDESFWINASKELPWICVRDESSLKSQILMSYNVEQLPSVFLIDRNGDIVDRPQKTDELDEKIQDLLK